MPTNDQYRRVYFEPHMRMESQQADDDSTPSYQLDFDVDIYLVRRRVSALRTLVGSDRCDVQVSAVSSALIVKVLSAPADMRLSVPATIRHEGHTRIPLRQFDACVNQFDDALPVRVTVDQDCLVTFRQGSSSLTTGVYADHGLNETGRLDYGTSVRSPVSGPSFFTALSAGLQYVTSLPGGTSSVPERRLDTRQAIELHLNRSESRLVIADSFTLVVIPLPMQYCDPKDAVVRIGRQQLAFLAQLKTTKKVDIWVDRGLGLSEGTNHLYFVRGIEAPAVSTSVLDEFQAELRVTVGAGYFQAVVGRFSALDDQRALDSVVVSAGTMLLRAQDSWLMCEGSLPAVGDDLPPFSLPARLLEQVSALAEDRIEFSLSLTSRVLRVRPSAHSEISVAVAIGPFQ